MLLEMEDYELIDPADQSLVDLDTPMGELGITSALLQQKGMSDTSHKSIYP